MESAADFWIYIRILKKRLWLTVLLFLVTVGVILAVSYTAEPAYRATVRLQVLATDSAEVSLFSTYRASSTFDQIQQAQNDFIRAFRSPFVAWKTIADLNLEIGALDLLDGLTVAVEGDFVIVMVQSDDPGRAEGIATAQVNNALEYYRGVRATPSRVLREFVSELLALEKENMVQAESAFLEFKHEHSIDSIRQETQALQDLVRNLKLERDRAIIERDRAATFAQVYRREEAKALAKVEEISAAGSRTSSGSTGSPYTLKFYSDQALQHEATAVNYEATRDGYAQSVAIYGGMIAERTQELRDLLGLYSEFSALESKVNRANGTYSFLLDKEHEARLKQLQAERLGYIQIVEPARKPDAPVPSKMLQLLMVGGVVSVLIGFLLSFVIEFLGSIARSSRKERIG